VVRLQIEARLAGSSGRQLKKSPPSLLSSFTTFQGLLTICASKTGNERDGRLRMRKGMLRAIAGTFFLLAAVSAVQAQQQQPNGADSNAPAAPQPAESNTQKQEKPPAATITDVRPRIHSFWDRNNDLLFAGVGAGRALDYASTLNLRHRGINEALLTNSIVDNHPLFAGIEVAATAASVGVSYLFHRTGHHRLERWTSAIHTGVAVGGTIRNYRLKSPNSN
jgi:hypothetical protein